MDFMVFNQNIEAIDVVDIYKSIIWTDRFDEPGDFEIVTNASKENIQKFALNNYIWSSHTNKLMVVENVEISSDVENGKELNISGRSLESILERRIIWNLTKLNGKLESEFEKLLNDAIIKPTNTKRKINNFKFRYSNDTYISSIDFKHQFTGRTLAEVVKAICDKYHIGYKITLEDGDFIFQFYSGRDLSYSQIMNPWVVFSEENGNLLNGSSIHSNDEYYNIALVAGEGEGTSRERVVMGEDATGNEGINRREIYVDARDLQHTIKNDEGEEIELDTEGYQEELRNRGIETLNEYKEVHKFEGEGNPHEGDYVVGKDYDIGDICEFEDEYGLDDKVRVVELIYSEDDSENKYYPSFRSLSEEIDVKIEDDEDESDGGGGDVIIPGGG